MPKNTEAKSALLSGLTLDAGRAYQENMRLYGEAKAREMHDVSNKNIAAVSKLLNDFELLAKGVEHEGSMRAINAGLKVDHWKGQLTSTLRMAYDEVIGAQPVAAG